MSHANEADVTAKPKQIEVARQKAEYAQKAITRGSLDYGISFLQDACRLDPANLAYRQLLRRAEKTKYKNNMRGTWHALLTTQFASARMQRALQAGDHGEVLVQGEAVLARNPWHTRAQLAMAQAAEAKGLCDLALWILVQARQKDARDIRVNRALARLHEQAGRFKLAAPLWELVVQANPGDEEGCRKRMDLAAMDTIARGQWTENATDPAAPADVPDNPDHAAAEPAPAPKTDPQVRPIDVLRAKIAAEPDVASHYLQLAEYCQRHDELDKAREALQSGLKATGQDVDLQMALAKLEIDGCRKELRLAQQNLAAQPEDAQLQVLNQRLVKELNSRELEWHRRQLERNPTDHGARLELGLGLVRAERVDEAITELQAARKAPRCRWQALLGLGQCFQAKGNWLLARRNLTDALEAIPADQEEARKETLFLLANGSAVPRDWAAALEHGNELANLDYNYQNIGKRLDEWQAQVAAAKPNM